MAAARIIAWSPLPPYPDSPVAVMLMVNSRVRVLLGALLVVTAPLKLPAQQRPTPEQAQALLKARPELVQELRQRIIRSGMSADDVRARLRAEGYPENLLDAYLPGTQAGVPDSVGTDVLSAARLLGIVDSTMVDSNGVALPGLDSLLTDSNRRTLPRADSARLARTDSTRVVPTPRASLGEPPRAKTPSDEPDAKPGDETRIFGLDIFRRRTSQFDPNLAGPVDANYRVGPGDRLMLIISGQVNAAYPLDVTREGFVVVPAIGRIDVANLTMSQLENLFYDRLGRVYSEIRRRPGALTRFSLSPVNLRSNQVYVIGDVVLPGSYRVSGAGTVLTALYAAGGPTGTGTLRAVEVRRGGRVMSTLDIYEYLVHGQAASDIRLENGDVVFVGVHGPRVQISGEVVRPATYEMRKGETLNDLVKTAGGFKPTASRQRVQIERISPATSAGQVGRERFVIDVASEQLSDGETAPVGLENGDIVRVFAITRRVRSNVRVLGNVWTPGRVAFVPGMRLSLALERAGGVKPDVYIGQVVISRLQSDSSRTRIYSSFQDTTGALVDDVPLRDDDEIQVFSVTEFRQDRYVNIAGAVRKPGEYPYREGMTLRDLVLQAGGLHERALLTEAELARMPTDRSGGRLAVTSRVPLDSTYLFERVADGKYLGPPGVPAPKSHAPSLTLQAYDNVLILEQPDWNMPRLVNVTGEVRLPGAYTLISKQERLSDLIRRAGGLTEQAYPAGVVFIRGRDQIGRIGVDLPRVLRDGRYRDNLQLEAGDNIYIPTYRATVVVKGAVNSPVAVSYVRGRDIDWYISAAGGPTHKADASRAWVVQPNGIVESSRRRVLAPDSKPNPEPGSTVQVPEKDPNDKTDRLALAGSITQILASLVAIIAISKR